MPSRAHWASISTRWGPDIFNANSILCDAACVCACPQRVRHDKAGVAAYSDRASNSILLVGQSALI